MKCCIMDKGQSNFESDGNILCYLYNRFHLSKEAELYTKKGKFYCMEAVTDFIS